MTAVRLRFKEAIPAPVDAGALLPEALAGLSEGELAALELRVGHVRVPLGDLAEISPGDVDTLTIEGAFAGLDRLGHGMARGRLEIYGDVGAYLGQGMTGGRIELFGSAGVHAASGMRGGIIRISANAGDFLGAALPGDPLGMHNGTVLVGGDAGDRVGDRMRRGLIVVAGRIGDYAASRMVAGTLVAAGSCGINPGYGMRRGTLVLARAPASLLATFSDNGTHDLPWLRLLGRHLLEVQAPIELDTMRAARWTGDLATGGKGEILVAA